MVHFHDNECGFFGGVLVVSMMEGWAGNSVTFLIFLTLPITNLH